MRLRIIDNEILNRVRDKFGLKIFGEVSKLRKRLIYDEINKIRKVVDYNVRVKVKNIIIGEVIKHTRNQA